MDPDHSPDEEPRPPKSPKTFPPVQFESEPLHLLDDISEENSPELTPRVSDENITPRAAGGGTSSGLSIPEDKSKIVPESLPDSGYKGDADEDEDEAADSALSACNKKPTAVEDEDIAEGDTEYFWEGGDTDVDSLTSDREFLEFTDEDADGFEKEEQSRSEKETVELKVKPDQLNPQVIPELGESESSASSEPSIVQDESAVKLFQTKPQEENIDDDNFALTQEANAITNEILSKELADALECEKNLIEKSNENSPSSTNRGLLEGEDDLSLNESPGGDALDDIPLSNQEPRDKQVIEDTILKDDCKYWVKSDEKNGSTKVPERVRQIVTKHLSYEDLTVDAMSRPSSLSLEEENRMLQDELNRVEDLLSNSRAERDELSIKYNVLSEKIEKLIRTQSGIEDLSGEADSGSVLQQNLELRKRLEEERVKNEKKVQKYKENQQNQAILVQKLQAKIFQYKQKCAELESSIHQHKLDIDDYKSLKSVGGDYSNNQVQEQREEKLDLETALLKLDEQHNRCASLTYVNSLLREQLDTATQANQSLTADIHKLTVDWQRTREELDLREEEWREEEQSFNNHLTYEHNRLLTLWREVTSVQREFGEMKIATERDLSLLKNDVSKTSQNLCLACLSAFTHISLGKSGSFQDKTIEEILEMNPTELWLQIQELTKQQSKWEGDRHDLKSKIDELNIQVDRLKSQIDDKDKVIRLLHRKVEEIEQIKSEVDEARQLETSSANKLREDIDFLQNSLGEISDIVEEDQFYSSFQADGSFALSRIRSPIRARGRSLSPISPRVSFRSSSPVFAESTVTAVKSSFNKKQFLIQELQTKLAQASQQLAALNKHNEENEAEKKKLKTDLYRLKEEVEFARQGIENCQKEKEKYLSALTSSSSEKRELEDHRRLLNEEIDNLQHEHDKLAKTNVELRRIRNELEDEKEILQEENKKQRDELDEFERHLELINEKNLILKEEIISLNETIQKTNLDKDILEQEKAELHAAFNQMESKTGDVEIEITKLKTEEDSLRDSLTRLQILNEDLTREKTDLNRIITNLEREKYLLQVEKAENELEKNSLKEEILRLEKQNVDNDSQKLFLNKAMAEADENKEKLEATIAHKVRETNELQAILANEVRKKTNCIEELSTVRRTAERQAEQLDKMSKEKEQLAKERSELLVKLNGMERELQSMSESLSAFRNEKINLEVALYETQQSAQLLEAKKDQIVAENQEINLKREGLQHQMNQLRNELQSEITKLNRTREMLNYKLQQTENEFRVATEKTKTIHEEQVKRMQEEKEKLRVRLESLHSEELDKLNSERNELIADYEMKIKNFQKQIDQMRSEHKQDLENMDLERKEAIEELIRQQNIVQEQLQEKKEESVRLQKRLEEVERLSELKTEQDHSALLVIQEQLNDYKSQMEEAAAAHEKSLKELKNQLSDAYHQRELLNQEISDLKSQLQVVEITRDSTRKELTEYSRKLNQVDDQVQSYKKEIADLRRCLTETKLEREALQKSNEELRLKIKQSESERLETKRSLEDARQRNIVLEESTVTVSKEMSDVRSTLRDVEKARADYHREIQDLQRQIRGLETELNRKDQEVAELRARLKKEDDKDGENRRQSYLIKQKLTEVENDRDSVRKELNTVKRVMVEKEDSCRRREKELLHTLDDARQNAKKLEEQRQQLENRLVASELNVKDLNTQLSASQGQIGALEKQISNLEGSKRNVEKKLLNVNSSLRQFLGVRDRSVSPIRSRSPIRWKSPSQVRFAPGDVHGSPRKSPVRSSSREGISTLASEIDADAIRNALRDVMQQMAKTEKERDELKIQLRNLNLTIGEKNDQQQQVENRLQKLQRALSSAEEENRNSDKKLTTALTTIQMHSDTIELKERDHQLLLEKISNLEQMLQTESNDKKQLVKKLSKLKDNETRQANTIERLEDSLKNVELHYSKLEVYKRTQDGDLQRLRSSLKDKESEIEKLQKMVDGQVREIREMEEKISVQQQTVDKLNLTIGKTTEGEHELRDKVDVLNKSLSESTSSSFLMQEKLKQLQKSLANSENERRVLEERLENSMYSANESKKQCSYLQDKIMKMEQKFNAIEQKKIELEVQTRNSQMLLKQRSDGDQGNLLQIQKLQEEKSVLQEKLNQLQKSMMQWELDKREMERTHIRLEKDKSALKKTLDKVEREKLLTEDIKRISPLQKSEKYFDHEISELHRQIQSLQTQLREEENRHRMDKEIDAERYRSAQAQALKTLESREKNYKQRIVGLEQQIQVLRDQLNQEIRKRQQFIRQSAKTGDEISELRSTLDRSLRTVSKDPTTLETETRRLDSTLGSHRSSPSKFSNNN